MGEIKKWRGEGKETENSKHLFLGPCAILSSQKPFGRMKICHPPQPGIHILNSGNNKIVL